MMAQRDETRTTADVGKPTAEMEHAARDQIACRFAADADARAVVLDMLGLAKARQETRCGRYRRPAGGYPPRSDGEKACTKCGVVKPRTEFYPVKRARDGRQYQCKECMRADMRAARRDGRRRTDRRKSAEELRPCGTEAAWMRHKQRSEPIDQACHEAHLRYHREYKKNRRAQQRAEAGAAA